MRNFIADSIKKCAIFIAVLGCVISIIIAYNNSSEEFNLISLFVGIFISLFSALLIAGFGELIEVLQRGFYELNKTQTETRNVLYMLYDKLQSEPNENQNSD